MIVLCGGLVINEGLHQDGTRMDKLPQAYGVKQATVQGVFKGGHKNGAGTLVGEGKEIAADQGEEDGRNIAVDDMGETKGQGTDQEHGLFAGEEGAVATEQEGAIKEFLGIDGQQGIKDEDRQPDSSLVAGIIKKVFRLDRRNRDQGDEGQGEKSRDNAFSVVSQGKQIAEGGTREIFVAPEIPGGKEAASDDKRKRMCSAKTDGKQNGKDKKDTDKLCGQQCPGELMRRMSDSNMRRIHRITS